MYSTPCPKCRQLVSYSDEQLGQRAACKKCKHSFTLPAHPPEALELPPDDPPAEDRYEFACPNCGSQIEARTRAICKQVKCSICEQRVLVPEPPEPDRSPTGSRRRWLRWGIGVGFLALFVGAGIGVSRYIEHERVKAQEEADVQELLQTWTEMLDLVATTTDAKSVEKVKQRLDELNERVRGLCERVTNIPLERKTRYFEKYADLERDLDAKCDKQAKRLVYGDLPGEAAPYVFPEWGLTTSKRIPGGEWVEFRTRSAKEVLGAAKRSP
jgi:hypothetical protein